MKNVLRWLKLALPFVHLAADELENIDDNETGTDDKSAVAIHYAADIIEAISKKKAIPYPPDALFASDATTAPLET
jgi:hypothetical protein